MGHLKTHMLVRVRWVKKLLVVLVENPTKRRCEAVSPDKGGNSGGKDEDGKKDPLLVPYVAVLR